MSRIVYLNGEYVEEAEARVSIFDRAFLFGDGVYEVTAVLGGKLVDFAPHLQRLVRSLGELEMGQPLDEKALQDMHMELVKRNGLDEGVVYLQITRGVADRDFTYPNGAAQTVVGFTQVKSLADHPQAKTGIKVVTMPDIRWQRRDIKSTALLAQAMGKEAAKRAGAFEGWMVEDGTVTEGTSSSAFIVTKANALVTRPLSNRILPGVTRRAVLKLAERGKVTIEERPFTVDEAKGAAEAFLTSASTFVLPVVELDGAPVGNGKPGPVTQELRQLYVDEARRG